MRGSTEEPRKICAERFEKERDREGKQKKKKIDHRDYISNIQTEEGPLKDQYITRNREDTEEEGEQTGSDDTPMSGGEPTREEVQETESAHETGGISQQKGPSFKKMKVITDENRLVNFGPYRMNTYGEVLRSNPKSAKSAIKENKRDNQKDRFTHWAVAFVMETFFAEGQEEEGGILAEDQQIPEVGCRPRFRRMKSAERSRKRGRWRAGY